MSLSTIRVTAVQLAVTNNVEANLATCLRLLDEAAAVKPNVVVLPEFCNHVAWYEDREHSYDVAVDLDGAFLAAIGAKAAEHGFYVMINCTVRRGDMRVTGTNLLYGPDGRLLAQSDKQVLMGNENNFLDKATRSCDVLDLPIGRVGMYSCMDGVIFETSRGMAVRGAQLLLNSLNSFAKDEGSLHIPVRAAENKVFVVAANKVGALVPPHLLEGVAARLKIAPSQLHGAGHSQIVAPDGTVLAKAPPSGEAVVFADIDVGLADEKRRPDGTDGMATRRPVLYEPFRQRPQTRQKSSGVAEVVTAVFQPTQRGETAVSELIASLPQAVAQHVKLITLPELFHVVDGRVENIAATAAYSVQMMATVMASLPDDLLVATTVVEIDEKGVWHTAVLLANSGVLLRQPQLHMSARHSWVTQLGDGVETADVAWGRIGLVAGNDAIYPETFRLLVLQDTEVVAVSTQILEVWESKLGLRERAAENRMNLVVGSLTDGLILGTDPDFTLWAEWEKRPFDGNINYPLVTEAKPGLTVATIYPAATANRTISQKTNVVENRPWWLAEALLGD